MKAPTTNQISFAVALLGTVASIFLLAVYIPGEGLQAAALILGEVFLATSRLYLFYEGTALSEVNEKKAKTAFWLSVILSVAFVAYGIVIHNVNPAFKEYALALFLMIQLALAFTEWVFSKRTGEQVNTRLNKLRALAKAAVSSRGEFKRLTKKLRVDIEALKQSQLTLSKENSRQAERILKLEQETGKKMNSLLAAKPKLVRVNGGAVCHCPMCLAEGRINLLTGGTRSKVLVCDKHGEIIKVKS